MDTKRILIIDDEASFTRMVRINLEKCGEYEVKEENRAGYALATAREFKPDLILLDVIMPAMDGGDVAALIKKDRQLQHVPIIFLTATVSPGEAGSGGGVPGDLYVVLHVREHPIFMRRDDHVLCDANITFSQAALGTVLKVPTLEGEKELEIPPGTQAGTVFNTRVGPILS